MIFLAILGVAVYIILPLHFVMWLLERNDYKIFGWDADIYLVGVGTIFFLLALGIQILAWVGVFNVS